MQRSPSPDSKRAGTKRRLAHPRLSRRSWLKRIVAAPAALAAHRTALTQASVGTSGQPSTRIAKKRQRFAGQEIKIQIVDAKIREVFLEIAAEFEAETGASVLIAADSVSAAYPRLVGDVTAGAPTIDGALVPAFRLGDLVTRGYILPVEQYVDQEGVSLDFHDELPAIRQLRRYGDRQFAIPVDAECRLLFYRRDVLTDEAHRERYAAQTGRELRPPHTWDELITMVEYFDSGDGPAGIAIPTQVGGQIAMHYWGISAPYVLGPENHDLYWFDPESMAALLNSPGHIEGAETLRRLISLSSNAGTSGTTGATWMKFLDGNAVFTIATPALAALGYEQNRAIVGNIGVRPLPGITHYTVPGSNSRISTETPNYVGNTIGSSLSGVILRTTSTPEAVVDFFSRLARHEVQQEYAARFTDGLNLGRFSQIPSESAEAGQGSLETYEAFGWEREDALDLTSAVFQTLTNDVQLPHLRLIGADEYHEAMERILFQYVEGSFPSAQEAMDRLTTELDDITVRYGVEQQLVSYRESLGLT
jgi:multiple sugar transport system substrate-binding protein